VIHQKPHRRKYLPFDNGGSIARSLWPVVLCVFLFNTLACNFVSSRQPELLEMKQEEVSARLDWVVAHTWTGNPFKLGVVNLRGRAERSRDSSYWIEVEVGAENTTVISDLLSRELLRPNAKVTSINPWVLQIPKLRNGDPIWPLSILSRAPLRTSISVPGQVMPVYIFGPCAGNKFYIVSFDS
jgi:hypothetical protein